MPQETIRREFARLHRENLIVSAVGLAVIILVVLVVGWFSDHRSCLRSVPLRQFVIDQKPIDRKAEAYWRQLGDYQTAKRIHERLKAEAKVRQLDCSGLLPGA
jgi:hypothetical protein